jgi:hypothetical protein
LQSKHLLAQYLRVTVEQLDALAERPEYNCFIDCTKPDKPRNIQEPIGLTMRVHYRLARLLDRIERPGFLHSATRKRSNITNAKAHIGGKNVVSTDIRKFYESTSYLHVKSFLHRELGWAHHIAIIMAKICTVEEHLPTGSCISPIMSYFVHRSMFAAIEKRCSLFNVVLTLYVDDLTASGNQASNSLLRDIKKIVSKHGLQTHKDKLVARGHSATITGVIVGGAEVHLPNKQHLAIVELIQEVASGDVTQHERLKGKLASAHSVDPVATKRLTGRFKRQVQLREQSGRTTSE